MVKIFLKLKDRILDRGVVFNLVRSITDSRSRNLDVIKAELNAGKNEKVLDIGCGIGNFSKVTEGSYLGIDANKSFIDFANKNYGTENKKFIVMDAKKLKFKDKSFDKSIFISMLHHFSDGDSKKVLKEASRVTKKYMVILDILSIKNN